MDFFPTDVQVRISGDHNAGLLLMGEARNMLFKAQLMFAQNGKPVQVSGNYPNGSVSVLLHGTLKIVSIIPTPPVPETEEFNPSIYVLCGEIMGGKVHVDPDTGKRYLRQYRPTLPTAISHSIPNRFHDNERLCPPTGVDTSDTDYVFNKATLFSGSMKRVVQAVQGLGKINDKSGSYITAVSAQRYVTMQYVPSEHGIVKAGDRNHWLISITTTNGILAMPLPLVPSTRGGKYRRHLQTIGDLGGLEIVNEFGGLPSGETFPTGATLATNITNGKILQLMTGADFLATYDFAYWSSSWAFSETTGRARTTSIGRKFFSAGDTIQSLVSTHWEMQISLSQYDLGAIARHEPVGVGTATIEKIGEGRIGRHACRNLWFGPGESLGLVLLNFDSEFGAHTLMDASDPFLLSVGDEQLGFGAVVYSFFDGDTPKTLYWVPPVLIANGGHLVSITTTPLDSEPPADFVEVFFTYAYMQSPAAYVGSDLDLRETVQVFYPYAKATGTFPTGTFDGDQYNWGVDSTPVPADRQVSVWAMIPGMTRESYAIVESTATADAALDTSGGGYNTAFINPQAAGTTYANLCGIGNVHLATDSRVGTPIYTANVYCAAVYNGAERDSGDNPSETAYVITEGFQYNMPPPTVGSYRRSGLLAGAETATPQYTNFIGSMRDS